ncbi:hypothetical protein N7457_005882 [Penicillium paradoxum]|uniref:uncharacterized protein n=1 Tax=Penicillium paradoxum TaxID=176176 RepID=UPI0025468BFC|nr:uncharacterized protein N7457_005882 [Penicillium paradoxum]KAJ5780722.1 hypothetical protein N7457_005882 [Penicillium paradoxum]
MSLFSLPTECLLNVISLLDHASDLNAVTKTCKFLRALANQDLYTRFSGKCSSETLDRLLRNGEALALRRLLEHGVDFTKSLPHSTINMILDAIGKGNLEIIRLVLDIDPACVNQTGSVLGLAPSRMFLPAHLPLLMALINGQMDIAEFLISRGARADPSPELEKRGALCSAAWCGKLVAVDFLVKRLQYDVNFSYNEYSPFYQAVEKSHWHVASYLLEAGADPLADWAGQSSSNLLSRKDQKKLRRAFASLLLQLQADPTQSKSKDGWNRVVKVDKITAFVKKMVEAFDALGENNDV